MPTNWSCVGQAVLLVGLIVAANYSYAFEIGNFKSGMSSGEAKAVAHERGWTMVASPPLLGIERLPSRTSFDVTNGRTSLEFCNDRLANMRTVLPGGFKGMVSVIGDLIDHYGDPLTSAENVAAGPPEVSRLSLTWVLKDGEKREILYTDQGGAEEPWALYFLTASPGICDRTP